MEFILPLSFGIGLSASCGFRVFVPFLVLGLLAREGYVDLPAGLLWVDDPLAILVLGAATAVEVLAYYIPVVDNVVNFIEGPLAAIAGTLVTAAFLGDLDPVFQWTLAAIAGGGVASSIAGATGTTRLASTGVTGGLANPLVSTIELLCAIVLSVLSLLVPVLAAVLVVGLIVFALKTMARLFRRKRLR